MNENDRYAHILDRCLEHEDKAHRDAVLSEYPEHVSDIVHRAMMRGIATRLAGWIRHAGKAANVGGEERPSLTRKRLAAVNPKWLRSRVETMVREMMEGK